MQAFRAKAKRNMQTAKTVEEMSMEKKNSAQVKKTGEKKAPSMG